MKRWRIQLQRIGMMVGAGILIYQAVVGWQALVNRNTIFTAPGLLLLSMATIGITYFLQMTSWSFLMRGLGISIHGRALLGGYFINFLPRYIPGSIWGYVSRSEWLRREYQVEYSVSNSGSLLEVAIAVLASLLTIGLYWAYSQPGFSQVLCGIVVVFLPVLVWWCMKWALGLKWLKKSLSPFANLELLSTFPRKYWFISVCINTVNMVLYGLSLQFVINSLLQPSVEMTLYSLIHISSLHSSAWLIGFFIFFVPSGLGVREFTLSNLLENFLHIPIEFAGGAAVLFRLVQIASEIILVLFALLVKLPGLNWMFEKTKK